MEPDPTLRAAQQPEDLDRPMRPQALSEFVGQEEARANLRVFIESARRRGEAMDHTLFHGPPGLGKTTLARTFAQALNCEAPEAERLVAAYADEARRSGQLGQANDRATMA